MKLFIAALLSLLAGLAQANEAVIRKAIAERIPDFPKIDEVRPTPIPGLFEVRIGLDIFYSDPTGQYLLQDAQMVDLKTRANLTQARIDQLSQVNFASLPLKDAMVWKRGNGQRKIAVFSDPNCGFCKRLERTLQELNNVTVYTFLIPILGPDSNEKSRNVWCAKDNVNVWLDWMLRAKQPEKLAGKCDESAIQRNRAFARQHRITGTPAILFEDGSRAPGALDLQALEERLKRAENREGREAKGG
ncbi:MAG: DsbC family protein [Burkholderiales bacterium]|nr:DsbC family protein [Burkholderiales bacterium]